MNIIYHKYIDAIKFEQWKIDSLQLSHVVRRSECEEINELTKEFLNHYQIKLQNCYDTAYQCAIHCKNVSFIIGYIITGYNHIYSHVWNKYNDIEFDLIQELNPHNDAYYKIAVLLSTEILEIVGSEHSLEDYIILEYYYKKHIATEEDYVTIPVDRPPELNVYNEIRKRFQELKENI